jgi:hypothetical protein
MILSRHNWTALFALQSQHNSTYEKSEPPTRVASCSNYRGYWQPKIEFTLFSNPLGTQTQYRHQQGKASARHQSWQLLQFGSNLVAIVLNSLAISIAYVRTRHVTMLKCRVLIADVHCMLTIDTSMVVRVAKKYTTAQAQWNNKNQNYHCNEVKIWWTFNKRDVSDDGNISCRPSL